MANTGKIKEPILVKNPNTGRFINIAPLFDAMQEADGRHQNQVQNLKEAVSRTIRAVNLAWDGELTDQKNVNVDMYLLEDMFDAMIEYKS